jgi:nucleoside-diphosphate-sugar epimerase
MQGTVLLTGASGYIGSHVLDLLMKQQYTVIATVRNDQQSDYFAEKYPNSNLGFVHVTDVTDENAFDFIMKYNHNITHVIHLACHKPIAVVDREKELFDPAVKANTNMIDAVFKYGRHVKSVVIASCFLAMMNNPPRFSDARKIYSARDVNPITREEARRGDDYSAMVGAKTFAEVAAWKNYTDLFCPKFALQSILFPMIYDFGSSNP